MIYPLIVIQASLREMARSLRGKQDSTEDNRAKQYKLMEVLGLIILTRIFFVMFSYFILTGEAIPQLVIRSESQNLVVDIFCHNVTMSQ